MGDSEKAEAPRKAEIHRKVGWRRRVEALEVRLAKIELAFTGMARRLETSDTMGSAMMNTLLELGHEDLAVKNCADLGLTLQVGPPPEPEPKSELVLPPNLVLPR